MDSIDPLFFIIVALILVGLLVVLQPILSNKKNTSNNNYKPSGKPLSNALILYGTQSGNAHLIATELQKQMSLNGFAIKCTNMLNMKLSDLDNIDHLFMVISTYGEGEMPPEAEDFYLTLKESAKTLNLQYSICALGDSSYAYFCESGIQFNEVLKAKGAVPLSAMQKCDEDFTEDASAWIKQSTKKLLELEGSKASVTTNTLSLDVNKKEYKATLVDRKVLASDSDENTILHLSFKVDDEAFKYQAGDTIEVLPKNPDEIIKAVATQLKTTDKKYINTIAKKELTNLSRKTLLAYSELSNNKKLKMLLANKEQLDEYLYKANVLDMLRDFKVNAPISKILGLIPSLKKRVYSIASSELMHPNQIDLCIKTIRYPYNNSAHEGAGSVHLNEGIKVGDTIQFVLKSNPHFKLPNNSKPIIMIATGTGIAPFRSFIQEIAAKQSERDSWLIWGQKYRANYAYYHQEFEKAQASGLLKAFTPCFSKEESEFHYVQDVLKAQENELLSLLNKGASIYLCGSQAMATGVKQTLNLLLQKSAHTSVTTLVKQKRWFEDVY